MTETPKDTSRLAPEMGPAEFNAWRRLLEQRLGMALPAFRKPFLELALMRRMRALDLSSYEHYRQIVVEGHARAQMEWLRLVDELTIQETRFFRDPDAFALAEQQMDRCWQYKSKLTLWSLGCSTGEEAYGLAILAAELSTQHENSRFAVFASDISTPALAAARLGRYARDRVANLPLDYQQRYFVSDGNKVQLVNSIRQRCCFFRGNLQELQQHPLQNMDLIYCQNVLIYFSQAQKQALIPVVCDRLAAGGMLILGPGEYSGPMPESMQRVPNPRVLAWQKSITVAAEPQE